MSFPAHFDIRGSELLVPDLHARVTIMDKDNKVITHLGYDQAWTERVLAGGKLTMRGTPAEWQTGRFIHPHDACFDREGNIFVVEWVPTGRVTRLRASGLTAREHLGAPQYDLRPSTERLTLPKFS